MIGEIEALQRENDRFNSELTELGVKVARGSMMTAEAKKRARDASFARDDRVILIRVLEGAKGELSRKYEALMRPNPTSNLIPPVAAEQQARSASLHQQVIFWELLERFRQTGDQGNDEQNMLSQAHRCRFTEEEREEADQAYRQVRKELGLFHYFSCRQVGGVIKR